MTIAQLERGRERSRRWHANNRDKVNAAARRRYAANPTPFLTRNKKSHAKHRDTRNAQKKLWRARNLKKMRQCSLDWARNNPEKVKRTQRQHVLRNKPKYSAYSAKRRTRMAGASLAEVYDRLHLKTFCYWCERVLTAVNRTVDHVVPLSRGGTHTEDNLVASCKSCNCRKNNKLYWEWDGELAA